MSCLMTWLCHSSLPVLASSDTRVFEYSVLPLRLEPFGYFLLPGQGAGLAIEANRWPCPSMAIGHHEPPPLLTSGWPQRLLVVVRNFHSTLPVLSFNA